MPQTTGDMNGLAGLVREVAGVTRATVSADGATITVHIQMAVEQWRTCPAEI